MKLQVVAGVIGVAMLGFTALAQAPAAAPAFEVASIRAAGPPTPDKMRSGQFRTGTTIIGSRVDFEFVSLADLLPYIYRVKSLQINGPAWLRESRWNIQAKLPEGATKDQVPEMLQGLMADRFKLTVHHEKREQPVYELVVAKGGAKLEVAEAGTDAPASDGTENVIPNGFPGRMGPPPGGPGGPGGPRGGGPGDASPDGRGGRGGFISGGPNGTTTRISPNGNCGMHLEMTRLTMPALADALTPFLDKPVVDETGLAGPYKVVLDLPMEAMFAMMQNMMRTAGMPAPGQGGGPGGPGGPGPGGRGDGPGGRGGGPFAGCVEPGAADGSDASNAAITQAVQKLGLKLQARKMLFDTIVVDHLEKAPTEN